MRSDVYRGIAFRYMAAYGGYTALYLHRFCCASVGWTRGLTLPRAFSTAECTGAARRIRAARRSGRADGCGAGARVASDAAEGSAWCSRPCKAGGGRAAEVTSHPCAGPHVSRRCWSASTSRAGSGSSCSFSRDGSETPPPGLGRIEAPRRWPSWFRRAGQAASTNAEPGRGGTRLRDALVLRRRRCAPRTPLVAGLLPCQTGPAVQHL